MPEPCRPATHPATEEPPGAGSRYALSGGVEPLVFLNFKDGEYLSDGDPVLVGALLTEDANYGTWDPADIQAGVGLAPAVDPAAPVFTGDALALILSGSTTVTRFMAAATNNFRYEMVDNFIDYGTYYYSQSSPDGGNNRIGDQVNPDVAEAGLSVGTHKVALNFINGEIARSTDESAIIEISPAAAWSPAPGAMGFVVPAGWVVESIGIYPAQSKASLPGLAAA